MIYFAIAILSEAVWDNLKTIYPKEIAPWIDRLAVMALAVFMCAMTGADLLQEFGIHVAGGTIMTGILCSRGANILHDLVKKLKGSD